MDKFLVIAQVDDEEPFMEFVNEARLAEWIDGSDYLPISVKEIYVLRAGKLVKCEFEGTKKVPYPDPENEKSLIYAYSYLYAGDERVASIPLTDH